MSVIVRHLLKLTLYKISMDKIATIFWVMFIDNVKKSHNCHHQGTTREFPNPENATYQCLWFAEAEINLFSHVMINLMTYYYDLEICLGIVVS